jgi:hypothetical protein
MFWFNLFKKICNILKDLNFNLQKAQFQPNFKIFVNYFCKLLKTWQDQMKIILPDYCCKRLAFKYKEDTRNYNHEPNRPKCKAANQT